MDTLRIPSSASYPLVVRDMVVENEKLYLAAVDENGKPCQRMADLRAYILSGKQTKMWRSGLTRYSRGRLRLTCERPRSIRCRWAPFLYASSKTARRVRRGRVL